MKYFSSFLLFSCFALKVAAQNHFVGVKGGYSWTNVATNAFAIHETQPGFSVGLTYDFVTKKRFLISAELLYEQRGHVNKLIFADDNGNPTGEEYPVPFHHNYFSLPLKFGYSVGNKFFGFASFGVCPALLHKATITVPLFNYPQVTHRGDTTLVLTETSKFDLSGLADISFGYQITNKFSVVTSFRYQYSFTSMTNENYFKYYYIKNYGMTLSLGIRYNLSYKSQSEIVPASK